MKSCYDRLVSSDELRKQMTDQGFDKLQSRTKIALFNGPIDIRPNVLHQCLGGIETFLDGMGHEDVNAIIELVPWKSTWSARTSGGHADYDQRRPKKVL